MKLGIKKIEVIPAGDIRDYSYYPAGSKINPDPFILAHGRELPFLQENGEFHEEWHHDEKGIYSNFNFSGVIRAKKEENRDFLNFLVKSKNIYLITFIDGRQAIIGSLEFLPEFTYSQTESGISSAEFSFSITLESLHGVFWSSVPMS